MASYTDAITQFNPYVEQLPVDAMVKVGTQKQAMYEQGVQKIQSQIDQVAGLDVIRDIDKNYLQSKLNELGGNLTTVAGGDFSNFQLVNSVGGMTKQISRDPNVQTAVSSTQRVRKAQQEMEADIKAGASPENAAWFGKHLSEYLNDRDVKTSYSGGYTKYRDLNKKWMSVQEKLGATDTTTQLPYYQDAQGRFTDEKGKLLPEGTAPVVNEVMVEKIFKGKSPQAVKNAIMASMDEGDIQQLKITGWYHYKDVSLEGLKQVADNKYTQQVDLLNKQLSTYSTLKTLYPSNKEYQEAIDKKIKDVNDDYANTVESYKSSIDLISENPDSFRSQLYSQHAINEFAEAFSNYSESVKYVDNPYITKRDKDRTYQLAVDNYKLNNWKALDESKRGWATIKIAEAKEKREAQDKLKEGKLLNDGGLDQPLVNDVTQPTEKAFVEDLEKQKADLNGFKKEFKKNYFGKLTPDEFEKQYAFHLDAYNNGKETRAEWKTFFDTHGQLQQDYNNSAALLVSAQKEADEDLKKDPSYKQSLIDAQNQLNSINGGKPIVLKNSGSGSPLTNLKGYALSPAEMSQRILHGKARIIINNTSFGKGVSYVDPEKGLNISIPDPQYYTTWEGHSGDDVRENARMHKQLLGVAQYTNHNKKINETVAAKTGEILTQKAYQWQPKGFTFNVAKPEQRAFVSSAFGQFINRIETEKGRQETDVNVKDWDLTSAKYLLDDPKTHFGVVRQGNTVFLTMQGVGANGKPLPLQTIKATASEYKQVFNEDIVSPVQKVSDMIYANGNTNQQSEKKYSEIKDDPNAYLTAFFSKKQGSNLDNFPRVKNYNVKADIIQLPNNEYQSLFYIETINQNKEKEWLPVDNSENVSSDLNALVKGFAIMDDASIKKLLK